jgi:hypothetical protein
MQDRPDDDIRLDIQHDDMLARQNGPKRDFRADLRAAGRFDDGVDIEFGQHVGILRGDRAMGADGVGRHRDPVGDDHVFPPMPAEFEGADHPVRLHIGDHRRADALHEADLADRPCPHAAGTHEADLNGLLLRRPTIQSLLDHLRHRGFCLF